jgi:hypothetical protein
MQQNSSILIRQHSAIARPIRPRAIDLFHRILLDRRRDLGLSGKQSMAWISFEPIALPPGFFTFNQRERRHADFTGARPPSANRYDCSASPDFRRQKHERVTLLASLSSHD